MKTLFRSKARRVLRWGAVLVAAAAFAPAARGLQPDRPLQAAPPGKIVDVPGGRGEGELIRFDLRLPAALLALAPEEGARVVDWPVAPGVRRGVRLVRHEIYAPDAHVVRVEGPLRMEVPRSNLVFLWGSDDAGATRVVAAVDPTTRTLTARAHGPEGVFSIEPESSDRAGRHLLAAPVTPPDATWTCGQEDAVETSVDWGAKAGRAPAGRTAAVLSQLYTGVVAFDTDNEYMGFFSNNTTNATNYIASLVANVNTMYERDLKLRLLVGTTILRTTSPDPWTATGSGANGAQLNEFTNYWNTNYPKSGTPRSLAALLSGKSTGSGVSGIAWLASSVCGSGNDYAFCQLSHGGTWLWGDTLILGHELGHNMGSPHTHCYADPAPDRCYNGEACYSGPTSCPASATYNGVTATGTLMGYCHMLGGCSSSLVFHPSTISRYVGPTLDAGASGGCLALVTPPPPPPPPVSAPTLLNPVTPCRLLDTRNPAGPLGGPSIGAVSSRSFVATGTCGVPAGTIAISANATVVTPTAAGDLVLYPNGLASAPTASTLSFRSGQTRANNTIIYLASDGSFLIRNNAPGSLDFVLDVNGYFK